MKLSLTTSIASVGSMAGPKFGQASLNGSERGVTLKVDCSRKVKGRALRPNLPLRQSRLF